MEVVVLMALTVINAIVLRDIQALIVKQVNSLIEAASFLRQINFGFPYHSVSLPLPFPYFFFNLMLPRSRC